MGRRFKAEGTEREAVKALWRKVMKVKGSGEVRQ